MLPLGVSAPPPPPAASLPPLTAAANPPASASCARFFLREYMANMSAPMMMAAASTPMMMNTVELVPPDEPDEMEPLLSDRSELAVLPRLPLPAEEEAFEEDEELLEAAEELLEELDCELELLEELDLELLEELDLELLEELDLDVELLEELDLDVELLDALEPELEPDSHLEPLQPSSQAQEKLGVPSLAVAASWQEPWPLHCSPFTSQPSAPNHNFAKIAFSHQNKLPRKTFARLQKNKQHFCKHELDSRQMHASWPLAASDGQLPVDEPPHPSPATQLWMDVTESPATHVSPSLHSAVEVQLIAMTAAFAWRAVASNPSSVHAFASRILLEICLFAVVFSLSFKLTTA
ncbi:hypothetical protein BBJ28_00015413 [Nothophytophthora sp. Chile5]|nr:hypothetical protein BBJ28_00015413 [Nothophytophthora sp. Chile5]